MQGVLEWLPLGFVDTALSAGGVTNVASLVPPGAGSAMIQVTGGGVYWRADGTDASSGGGMFIPDSVANPLAPPFTIVNAPELLTKMRIFGTAAGRLRIQFFQHR
jgi:hypothetical protein